MRKLKSKNKFLYKISKYLPVFVILLAISIMVGSTFAYFTDRKDEESGLTFSKVELSSETTTGINGVIYDALPGSPLVDGVLSFSKSIDSEPIYVRAKLSYSLPAGANEGMNAIVDALRSADGYDIETNLPNGAKWSAKEGNYFYLLDSENNMFIVDTIDTYTLTSELVIPRDLEALDGNAQYMESVNFHIAFEAIQADNISTNINDIKTMFREIYPESEAEAIRYMVVITSQGESQSIMYNAGEVIESLDEPELDGYEFAGWFTKDGSESGDWGEEIAFPYVVNRNIYMFAKFVESNNPKVTYYNEDFTSVYQTIALSNSVKPTSIDYDDVEVGETFVGWFTDTTFESMFDFNSEITSSVNVYPLVKQETSVNDFVFSGGQITEYKGNATEVVIPETYSIGTTTTQTISIASQTEFEEKFMYGTPDIDYPVTFTDRLNQTYVVNEEYELIDIYFNISSSNYPITYEKSVFSYIEGADYNVNGISDGAFSGSSVQTIYIPNSYTTLGGFKGCTTLTKVYFSSNVTRLLESAFDGCTNLVLTTLVIDLTSIGHYTFRNCTNLALTSLPAGVTSIGVAAFEGCSNLALTSLPAGVTSISGSAFENCTNLALTSLPAGVTSIGSGAFENCTNLALTSLPAGVTNIEIYAFSGCTSLLSNDSVYYLPIEGTSNNVVIIAKSTSITSVTWPENVTMIVNGAFDGCSNLALTSLPAGLTSIGDFVFRNCSSLALTELPAGVTSIGVHAFSRCASLALTSLPAGLISIGVNAFRDCTNLALTSLPDGITKINDYAFQGCASLALTSLPTGITSLGVSVFQECTSLALTSLPAGLTKIGLFAFQGCTSLALTLLPAGVTSIGSYAFRYCNNLAVISLPAGITSIGTSAFDGCTNLNYILCESDAVATMAQGNGRDNTYIYSLQESGYAVGTSETEVIISDSVTIYTAEVDGVKWVRTSDNKYFKCIA